MKDLKIVLIIFCLGIFLFPKDNFYAQASQENCCKSESAGCCEKSDEEQNHSNDWSKNKKSCTDDCCSFCMTCHTFIQNTFSKKTFWALIPADEPDKNYAPYSNPYLSDSLKEIWQPPKLV